MINLVSAKDRMMNEPALWKDSLGDVPEGAKVLVIPPTAEINDVLELDLTEAAYWLISVGRGAKVVIKELSVTGEENVFIRLQLEDDAEVVYVVDEMIERKCNRTDRLAVLGRRAKIKWFGATMNQTGYVSRLETRLLGHEAKSDVNWLHLAKNNEKTEVELVNTFDAKNCKGEIFVKAAAQDQAQVKVVGGINITLNGRGTDSYLKEDSLILDKSARVRALPCLEIQTNDVKAGHGATVTNFTDEDLFYLRSRGLNRVQAREMMIRGFLESVLSDCPDDVLLEILQNNLAPL